MRGIRRATAAALVLVAATVGGLAAQEEPAGEDPAAKKGFRVEEASLDLGVVTAGQDAVATYVFHNDTDADVRILRAKPS